MGGGGAAYVVLELCGDAAPCFGHVDEVGAAVGAWNGEWEGHGEGEGFGHELVVDVPECAGFRDTSSCCFLFIGGDEDVGEFRVVVHGFVVGADCAERPAEVEEFLWGGGDVFEDDEFVCVYEVAEFLCVFSGCDADGVDAKYLCA